MIRDLLRRLGMGGPVAVPVPGPTALVTVYSREGRYFIEASHRTRWEEAGFWASSGEVFVVAGMDPDATLGEKVLDVLALSRVEVPVPPRDARLETGLFRAMGVSSRRAAMAGTRACLVSREPPEGALRIEPQRNGGTSGEARGYTAMPEAARVLAPTSDPMAVGRAVRDAVNQAVVVP